MGFLSRVLNRPEPTDLKVVWEVLKPRVAALSEPAIRLTKTTSRTRSWIGGQPAADSGEFFWPTLDGKPLSFIAQLDLAELAVAHRLSWLPSEGSIAFFYDIEHMPWGFDPKDRGSWHVAYFKSANTEVVYPQAFTGESQLNHSFVTASKVAVYPDPSVAAVEALNLSDEEADAYADFSNSDDAVDLPKHQVGGFPSPVQSNTMELECQLATNGIYVGKLEGFESPRAKELEAGASDWRLLLQLDSDDDLDFMWGDAGMIYFWIRQQDATERRFDRSWLILQCC
jgi:uncharacterized protein YwqG